MPNRAGPVRYHPEYECAIRASASLARSAAEGHFDFAVQANIPEHRAAAVTKGQSAMAVEAAILNQIGATPTPLKSYPALAERA